MGGENREGALLAGGVEALALLQADVLGLVAVLGLDRGDVAPLDTEVDGLALGRIGAAGGAGGVIALALGIEGLAVIEVDLAGLVAVLRLDRRDVALLQAV